MAARSALLIGNGEFSDRRLERLSSPAADVAALSAVLSDPAVGGYAVATLLDETSSSVRRAVDQLLGGAGPDDVVLLYYSGQGVLDPSGDLYLAAADTAVELLQSTAVAASFVRQAMDASRCGQVALILDCAHAGAAAGAAARGAR